MHVAVVAPQHPLTPEHGGIARYLRDYIPALAERTKVTMVTIEDGPELPGVDQVYVGFGRLPIAVAAPFRSRRVVAALRKLAPDCVEYANYLGLACLDTGPWPKVMRLSSPICKASPPATLLRRLVHPLHHRWEVLAARRMDYWISNTHANLKTCDAVYGCPHPASVIPHGLAADETDPEPDARDLLLVGTMESRKGVDVLIRAWRRLVAEPDLPPACLHLVGKDGRSASGSFLRDCLAPGEFGDDRLQWHGAIPDAELAALRRRCRITVVPSRYESFGMVALEAWAAGHALVASNAGGLAEVIDDEVTALAVKPGDVASLTAALDRLLRQRDFADLLARQGRQALRERFSMACMVERSLAAYRAAIAFANGDRPPDWQDARDQPSS